MLKIVLKNKTEIFDLEEKIMTTILIEADQLEYKESYEELTDKALGKYVDHMRSLEPPEAKWEDCNCEKIQQRHGMVSSTGGHGTNLPLGCSSCRMVRQHTSSCDNCDGDDPN